MLWTKTVRISTSFLLLLLIITSCSDSSINREEPPEEPPPSPPVETGSYTIEAAFPNISFNNPLDFQHPGDDSGRLFVVEQSGVIKVFDNKSSVSSASVFLDIKNQVTTGGERGLLGLAFHPNFASNGYFYLNYTTLNPLQTVISKFQVSSDNPNQADLASETILLTYNQPYGTHNAGQIRFGPDGYLYIASGDGGSAGDPRGNAQDRSTLLGNILRIDVDGSSNGNNYAIPPDNPFAGNDQGFREEIFAYGFRNPFRFSFDSETGNLWVGDVGQNRFEEIDIVKNGGNYGWNITEGDDCYQPSDCDRSGLTAPVYVYRHDIGVGEAVTGGFVYRGDRLKGLTGYYIYADYISGRIWALDTSDLQSPDNILLVESALSISSFGVDAENELYFTAFDGSIYQLAVADRGVGSQLSTIRFFKTHLIN